MCFCIVYGLEAVAPVEIVVSMHRARHFKQERNNGEQRLKLDMAEEKRRASKKNIRKNVNINSAVL